MEFLKLANLQAKTHKVARRAASKHAMRLSLQRFVRNVLLLEEPTLLLQRLGRTYPTPWRRMGDLFSPRASADYVRNFASEVAHLVHLPREQWWDRDEERCLLTGVHVPTPAAWAQHQSRAPFATALDHLRATKQRMGLAEARLRQALAFFACQHAPLNHHELTEGALARFFDALALPVQAPWRQFFREKRKRRRRFPQEPAEFEPWAVESAEVVTFLKEQASPPAYPELRPLQAYYVVLLEHVVRRLPFRRDSPLLHHVLDPTLAIVLRRCAWPIRCIFLHYCRRGRLPSGEGGGEEDAAESEGCGPEDRGRGTVHRPVMDLEGIKVFASDFGLMPGLMEEKLVETLHTYVLRSFAAPEPLTLNTLSVRGEYALPGLTFSAFVELLARCAMFCCPPKDKFTQRQAVEELACTFSSPAVGQRDRRQAVGTQRDMWRRREDTTPLSGTSSSHTVPLPLRADSQVIPEPGKALGPAGRRRVATAAIARPSTRRSASAGQVRREPVPRTGTATHDWDAALQVRYPSRFRGHSRRPQTAAAAHMRGVTSKARSDAKIALGLLQGADRASWSMPPPSGGAGGHGSKLAPQAASAHPSGWGNTVAGVGPAAYKTVGVSTAPGAGLARGPNQWDVVHEPAASMAVKAAQERDGRRATRLRRVGTRAQRDRMLARLGGQALGRLDLQLRSHQPTDGTFAPCPGPAPEALFAYQRKYVEAAAPARQPAARAAFARGRDGARGAGCGDTGTGPHPIHRVGGEGGAGRAQGATLRPRSAGPRKATARGVVSLSNALPAGTKERSAE